MTINRRGALALLGLGGGAVAASSAQAREEGDKPRFAHGVASGDPLADRVIIWTRVTQGQHQYPVDVRWEVFSDAGLKTRIGQGVAQAGPEHDFTAKADITGLKPGRDYWYRFSIQPLGEAPIYSPIGRARTLPAGKTRDVILAVASCSLYPGGFFNAYQAIADLGRVDAVVHLGDYIYEYGADTYGSNIGKKIGRLPTPAHECVSLADYRERFACHRLDPQLQAAHARAPWIVTWDDHETANDSYATGAENHQPAQEGDWDARKAAAIKAFYEWMPIREPEGSLFASYRSFHFGDLAALIMTETRLTARTQQLNYRLDLPMVDGKPDVAAFSAKWNDPARRMMSPEQEAWMGQALAASVKAGHAWQVLGNQVVMAKVMAPDMEKTVGKEKWAEALAKVPESDRGRITRLAALSVYDLPYNLDSWDGYPADRKRLLAAFKAAKANPIVLSGDSHASWANEILDEDGKTRLAAEFGSTGITSPGAPESLRNVKFDEALAEKNPEVVFSEHYTRGFLLLTLARQQATGALMGVSTVMEKTYTTAPIKTFAVKPAKGGGVSALREV